MLEEEEHSCYIKIKLVSKRGNQKAKRIQVKL